MIALNVVLLWHRRPTRWTDRRVFNKPYFLFRTLFIGFSGATIIILQQTTFGIFIKSYAFAVYSFRVEREIVIDPEKLLDHSRKSIHRPSAFYTCTRSTWILREYSILIDSTRAMQQYLSCLCVVCIKKFKKYFVRVCIQGDWKRRSCRFLIK